MKIKLSDISNFVIHRSVKLQFTEVIGLFLEGRKLEGLKLLGAVNPNHNIVDIANSLHEIGLYYPVLVAKRDGKYICTSGISRCLATAYTGEQYIEAIIDEGIQQR